MFFGIKMITHRSKRFLKASNISRSREYIVDLDGMLNVALAGDMIMYQQLETKFRILF